MGEQSYGGGAYGSGLYGGAAPPPFEPPGSLPGQLGCGEYELMLLTRGGGSAVARIEWTQLDWARVLDDTSEARVTMDLGCVGSVALARPWQHELGIFRNGILEWVGPVMNPSAPVSNDHTQFQLVARDLSAWWDRRFIHEDHDYFFTPTDLASIFEDIANDAMLPDNSPGITISTSPVGVTGAMTLLATQHLIAGPQLRDIGNTGIDWTATGRTILVGGRVIPVASVGTFIDDDFIRPPVPSYDGSQQANSWVVRGAGGGAAGDVIYGTASDPVAAARDGLLEGVDTVQTIQDNLSAQASAQSHLALSGANVVMLQDCEFSPQSIVVIENLIPGALAHIDLSEGSLTVDEDFRLQRLDVSVSGSDGIEHVAATFQPRGTL